MSRMQLSKYGSPHLRPGAYPKLFVVHWPKPSTFPGTGYGDGSEACLAHNILRSQFCTVSRTGAGLHVTVFFVCGHMELRYSVHTVVRGYEATEWFHHCHHIGEQQPFIKDTGTSSTLLLLPSRLHQLTGRMVKTS